MPNNVEILSSPFFFAVCMLMINEKRFIKPSQLKICKELF